MTNQSARASYKNAKIVDDETDELTLDAAAVVAEEAVERKEARRVKPWLSELDVPEWPGCIFCVMSMRCVRLWA
jgi:hypothetical protein